MDQLDRARRHRVAAASFVVASFVFAGACTASNTTTAGPSPNTDGGPVASGRSTVVPPTTSTRAGSNPSGRGSPGTASSAGDERPACELITESDASGAFGEPAVPGVQDVDECWWSSANDLKTINVRRRHGDVESWRAGHDNSSWQKIPLGDEGYEGRSLDAVEFRIGDTIYEVNVVYSTKGDAKKVAEDVAGTVLDRVR